MHSLSKQQLAWSDCCSTHSNMHLQTCAKSEQAAERAGLGLYIIYPNGDTFLKSNNSSMIGIHNLQEQGLGLQALGYNYNQLIESIMINKLTSKLTASLETAVEKKRRQLNSLTKTAFK